MTPALSFRLRPSRVVKLAAALLVSAGMLAFVAPGGVRAQGPASVADEAAQLQDAVVNISTSQKVSDDDAVPVPKVPKGSPFEEFFDDFFNGQGGDTDQQRVSSLGSGFVIDPSGLIVTNNHVIEGADEISATFPDGQTLKVTEVVGRDTKTDLALLRVEPKKPLKAVSFGNSGAIRVGDWVMAIGNPFGLGGSVSVGVVSAKKRDINSGPYDEFIQTDAAINRGNSGGPLFDMHGDVIGVNTAIISPTGGSIGIGFAIPSNTVKVVIDQLREYGKTRRGWLGVHIQTVTGDMAKSAGLDQTMGAFVSAVTPGSPAETAGLKPGDIIVSYDGQDVAEMRGLPKAVARTPIDKSVPIEVIRKGDRETINVTISLLAEDEDTETAAADETQTAPEGDPEILNQLGVAVAALTDDLRTQYGISQDVHGVIVTKVAPESVAAEKKVKVGDVIIEVTHKEVQSPSDVAARVATIRQSGRKSALLFVMGAQGELRFVAVPITG